MKKWTTLALLLALPASVAAAELRYERPPGFETPQIRDAPIAGVYNQHWYNYRTNILEAEKELSNDLEGASDREDHWDAWEEWATELIDADKDYVEEMRDDGYRSGRVTIG